MNVVKNATALTCEEDSLVPCGNASMTFDEGEVDRQTLEMNVLLDIMWTVLYSSMLIVAIAGNAIVMWIVTGESPICERYASSTLSEMCPVVSC